MASVIFANLAKMRLSYKKYEVSINILNIDGVNCLFADKRPGVIAPKINWEIHEER